MSLANTAHYLGWIGLLIVSVGTLLPLSNHPHWAIRSWDFPRAQLSGLSWLLVGLVLATNVTPKNQRTALVAIAVATAITAWHLYRILPYTPLLRRQSQSTPPNIRARRDLDGRSIRIVVSNVQLENEYYEQWMSVIGKQRPDVVMALEVNERWLGFTKSLAEQFPHRIELPQDNWYGMAIWSKLPIVDTHVHRLVQADVPSIDAKLQLNSATCVRLIAVHPRPPEPIRGNDSVARDAELLLWGQEIANDPGPVIIGGDLNDVAWSATTRLFLRTSQLLDPRRGRGMFNSFHAEHPLLRFPLDHVFHSSHFTVNSMQRLGYVGSDHFPIAIDLRYSPDTASELAPLADEPGDAQERECLIERAVQSVDCDGTAVDDFNSSAAVETSAAQ